MNTAKTLPWLANTAGIRLDRAAQLWNTASDSARNLTGESQSARYLSLAHDELVSLVEQEVLATSPVGETPWLMIQAHLSVIPMVIADIFAQAVVTTRQLIHRCKAKTESVV